MDYATMNRNDLRAACKAAGISYAKLTVDGMRDALALHVVSTTPINKLGLYGHGTSEANAVCPHCGINHMDNGYSVDEPGHRTDERQYQCLGCGGEWGPKVKRRTSTAPTGTGIKIEANREKRNGVTRPSVGGKCRAVWDALDRDVEAGQQPDAKRVRELAEVNGWNPNNAMCELYVWRKFNGLSKPRTAAA